MKGEQNRMIMIYVDSCIDGNPAGRFHIAADSQSRTFRSMSQLILRINEWLDQENFPQAFSKLRKFRDPGDAALSVSPESCQIKGEIATFVVRILFRQNASWQGSIKWVDTNQEEYFRSVLELMVLMDNALGYSKTV